MTQQETWEGAEPSSSEPGATVARHRRIDPQQVKRGTSGASRLISTALFFVLAVWVPLAWWAATKGDGEIKWPWLALPVFLTAVTFVAAKAWNLKHVGAVLLALIFVALPVAGVLVWSTPKLFSTPADTAYGSSTDAVPDGSETVTSGTPDDALLAAVSCINPTLNYNGDVNVTTVYACSGATSQDFVLTFPTTGNEQAWTTRVLGLGLGSSIVEGPGWAVQSGSQSMVAAAIDAGGTQIK